MVLPSKLYVAVAGVLVAFSVYAAASYFAGSGHPGDGAESAGPEVGAWDDGGPTVFPTPLKVYFSSRETFVIENTGNSIISNPRIFAENYPDIGSWNTLISSIASRAETNSYGVTNLDLVYELWRFLSDEIVHLCSPGRRGIVVNDALDLLRDYGYGCCSHVNRALPYLAAHLGILSRVVTTPKHEYAEILVSGAWQILDGDLKFRWYDAASGVPLGGVPGNGDSAGLTIAGVERAIMEFPSGKRKEISGTDLERFKTYYSKNIMQITNWGGLRADRTVDFDFFPGDKLVMEGNSSIESLQKSGSIYEGKFKLAPPVGKAVLRRVYRAGLQGVTADGSGNIIQFSTRLPYPLVGFVMHSKNAMDADKTMLGTNGGEVVGSVDGKRWVVNQGDLSDKRMNKNITIRLDGKSPEVSVEWVMQFNSAVLAGIGKKGTRAIYKDDSGFCRRRIRLGRVQYELGLVDCAPGEQKSKRIDFNLNQNDESQTVVSRVIDGGLGSYGVESRKNMQTTAYFALPLARKSYLTIKVVGDPNIAWSLRSRNRWISINSRQIGRHTWLRVGPNYDIHGGKLQLRARLMKVQSRRRTIIDHISLQAGPQWIGTLPIIIAKGT